MEDSNVTGAYMHTHHTTAKGGAGRLATRRTQPSSLAVSRLTAYAVEDL